MSTLAGLEVSGIVPPVLLAFPCELVKLSHVPDDAFLTCENPEAVTKVVHARREGCWHDTMTGFYRCAPRFLRVTKRGTVIVTMPRKDHPYSGAEKKRNAIQDRADLFADLAVTTASFAGAPAESVRSGSAAAPEEHGAAEQGTADEGEEEQVTGTFALQRIGALLPIYDLDTGKPFPGMCMLARVEHVVRRPKSVGEGTVAFIGLRAKPEFINELAQLVLALGQNSTSNLAYAFRDAKPFHINMIARVDEADAETENGGVVYGYDGQEIVMEQADEDDDDDGSPSNDRSPRAVGGSANATGASSPVAAAAADDDDDELYATLFGASEASDRTKNRAELRKKIEDELEADYSLRAALGLPPLDSATVDEARQQMLREAGLSAVYMNYDDAAARGDATTAAPAVDAYTSGDGTRDTQTLLTASGVVNGHRFQDAPEGALINPFRLGIGLVTPRLGVDPRIAEGDYELPTDQAPLLRRAGNAAPAADDQGGDSSQDTTPQRQQSAAADDIAALGQQPSDVVLMRAAAGLRAAAATGTDEAHDRHLASTVASGRAATISDDDAPHSHHNDVRSAMPVVEAYSRREATSFSGGEFNAFLQRAEDLRKRDAEHERGDVGEVLRVARAKVQAMRELPGIAHRDLRVMRGEAVDDDDAGGVTVTWRNRSGSRENSAPTDARHATLAERLPDAKAAASGAASSPSVADSFAVDGASSTNRQQPASPLQTGSPSTTAAAPPSDDPFSMQVTVGSVGARSNPLLLQAGGADAAEDPAAADEAAQAKAQRQEALALGSAEAMVDEVAKKKGTTLDWKNLKKMKPRVWRAGETASAKTWAL